MRYLTTTLILAALVLCGCGDDGPTKPEPEPTRIGTVIVGVTIPPVGSDLNNRTQVWEIAVYGEDVWCNIPEELRNGDQVAWPCSIEAITVKVDYVECHCPY